MFDEQVEGRRTQSTKNADRTMAQVRNQFDLPPQYEERAQAAYRKLIDASLTFPSSSEVVEFLIKSQRRRCPRRRRASLAYFSSEVAKRNLAASAGCRREASAFISERTRGLGSRRDAGIRRRNDGGDQGTQLRPRSRSRRRSSRGAPALQM
jgi:hypothetical protein